MFSASIGGYSSFSLPNFYSLNLSKLNDTMVRISSGKRFQASSAPTADYFHAQTMKNNVRELQSVNRDMVGAIGMVKVAETAGETVFDDVAKLKELVNHYWGTSNPDEQSILVTEFNVVKNRVISTIANSWYEDKQLLANNGSTPLRRVVLDPRNVSDTMDIMFDPVEVANVNSLTIGDSAGQEAEVNAIDAESFKAGNFLAKTTAYKETLTAFLNMNVKQGTTYIAAAENTENIDGIKESAELTKRQVAQQMTVSMMAQANMMRSSVLQLLGK